MPSDDEVSADCSNLPLLCPAHQYFSLDNSRAGEASVLFTIMGWLLLPQKAGSSRNKVNLSYNTQKTSQTTLESEVLRDATVIAETESWKHDL